jgi:hypothetical protein
MLARTGTFVAEEAAPVSRFFQIVRLGAVQVANDTIPAANAVVAPAAGTGLGVVAATAIVVVGAIVIAGGILYAAHVASEAKDLGPYGGTLPPGGVPEPTQQESPTPENAPPRTRHPDQTCDDDVYDRLRQAVLDCKTISFSCSDDAERESLGITTRKAFNKPGAPRWSKEEILRRLADAERCAKARNDFQNECFKGKANVGHEIQEADWEAAAETCREKARARGLL